LVTRLLRLLGGGLIALSTPLLAAPAATSKTSPIVQASPEALALAKLMSPRDLRIEGELKQFDQNFSKTLLLDEGGKALEAQYPGLTAALAKAVRPIVAETTARIIDQAYPAMAKGLAAGLTGEEIAELTAYYGSPAGQDFLRQMANSIDASDVYRQAAKNGRVTEDAATAQAFIAGIQATAQLSDADRQALKALTERPVYAKLQSIQPKLMKIILDASNAPDPEYKKRIEETMSAAFDAHVKAAAPKPGQTSK